MKNVLRIKTPNEFPLEYLQLFEHNSISMNVSFQSFHTEAIVMTSKHFGILCIQQIDTSKQEGIARFINLMLFPSFSDEKAFLLVNLAIDFWHIYGIGSLE